MHPVMVLVAFAIAALVTYVLVLAALSATSVLSHDNRDDAADDRHDPRQSPALVVDLAARTPLTPWLPASGDRALNEGDPADAPATDRRSHAQC